MLANTPIPINAHQPGYGRGQQVPITGGTPPADQNPDALNQWLHAQPWYQEALAAWGVNPSQPMLDPNQRTQLMEAAFRAGAQPGDDWSIGAHGGYENTKMPTYAKVAMGGALGLGGALALAPMLGAGAAAAGSGYVGADVAGTAAATSAAGLGTTAAGLGATATGGLGTMGAINSAVGSPLGQAVLGAAGSYFKSKSDAEAAALDRQQTANAAGINQTNLQSTQDRANAQAAASPLGESQNFVARNSLINAILPNMRNINSGVGKRPGAGSFLPSGGLDPKLIDSLYGANPTLESLAQRAKEKSAINPQAPTENLGSYGGFTPAQTQGHMSDIQAYQLEQQKKQDAQRKQVQSYINAGLQDKPGPLNNAIIGTGNRT